MARGGGNEAVKARAGTLLRARWVAAVALGVVAGVGGGLVLGLVAISQDTGSALGRYFARLDEADYGVLVCPLGLDASTATVDECSQHDPIEEVAALRDQPGVRSAGRFSPTPVAIRVAGGRWQPNFAWVAHDDTPLLGRPPLVAGRAADPDRAEEVMINEALAELLDLGPGSTLELAPASSDEVDTDAESLEPSLPSMTVEVTGVLRLAYDLVEPVTEGSLATIESTLLLGPAWAEAVAPTGYVRYGTGIGLRMEDGAEPNTVLTKAWPGQEFSVEPGALTGDGADGSREAIGYQARSAAAAAVLAGVAALALVCTLVVRQARRELADAGTLQALGMTRGMLARSVVPRWLLTAVVSVLVAGVTAAVIRRFGPVGIARRAADPGRGVPLGPLAVGAALLGLVVVGLAVLATYRATVPRSTRTATPGSVLGGARLSAEASLGLALTAGVGRRRWLVAPAVLSVGAAVAAAVAALTLGSSLDRVTGDPARHGVGWDAVATGLLGRGSSEWMAEELRTVEGIAAVAGVLGGDGVSLGDQQPYVYALTDVTGLAGGIVPTISRGRAPAAQDEIALGAQTMSDAGVDLGDTVSMTLMGTDIPLRVVGEVIVNDNYEADPGRGAVVAPELFTSRDPDAYASDYLVRFEPGRAGTGIEALERRFPGLISGARVQDDVLNLARLRSWPGWLALLLIAMAAVAFVAVVVGSVRDHRHQLAVAKALGSSRGQVGRSVLWYASLLAVPAVVLGVPAGVVLGRSGWGAIARGLGVPAAPVVPLAAVVLIAAAALAAANLLALWPARRAALLRPGDGLRVE